MSCVPSRFSLSPLLSIWLGTTAISAAWAQGASTPPPPAPVNSNTGNAGNTNKGTGDIVVNVGRAGVKNLKFAIPPFGNKGTGSPVKGDDLSKRLTDLLGFTGWFDFLAPSAYLNKTPIEGTPNFGDWEPLGTDLLISGSLEPTPGKNTFTLEMRLWDSRKKAMRMGKKYSDLTAPKVDAVLKRFADQVILNLTGEPGIFTAKIAFVAAAKPGEAKQVYIANIDGTGVEKITNNGFIHMSPSWSPDGSKLTFTSFEDGHAEIYLYNRITKKSFKLTNTQGNSSGSNWNPNGKSIAFSSSNKGSTAIYTMNSIDGGNKQLYISGSGLEVEAAWGPDGKTMAFVSGRFGNPHLFIRDLNSNQDTRITYAGYYNSSPSWRVDGKKLAFAGYDKEIDRYDIFIVNPDGRQMERLTLDQGDNEKPSWSPDGRFLIFQSNRLDKGKGKQRNYRLYTMGRDGDNQRPLNLPFYDVQMPSWGPRIDELNE